MKQSIAERRLLYSLKSEHDRKELTIRIGAPYPVDEETAGFRVDHGAAVCTVEFHGLDESNIDVHGIDLLHALALAVDVDPYLKHMKKKYDFYWPTGEPYFDET